MKKRGLFVLIFIFLIIGIVSAFSFNSNIFDNKNILKVTEEHPFLLNGSWIKASDLDVGDELVTIDGKKARISKITDVYENISVYNLDAGEYNDFIVEEGIIVHNSNQVLSFEDISKRLQSGERTLDEIDRIERANQILGKNGLPKLSSIEQENELLLAHYSNTGNVDKVLRLGEAGLSKSQITLLGDNWIFGDPVSAYHGISSSQRGGDAFKKLESIIDTGQLYPLSARGELDSIDILRSKVFEHASYHGKKGIISISDYVQKNINDKAFIDSLKIDDLQAVTDALKTYKMDNLDLDPVSGGRNYVNWFSRELTVYTDEIYFEFNLDSGEIIQAGGDIYVPKPVSLKNAKRLVISKDYASKVDDIRRMLLSKGYNIPIVIK